jgi:hypothetical protein
MSLYNSPVNKTLDKLGQALQRPTSGPLPAIMQTGHNTKYVHFLLQSYCNSQSGLILFSSSSNLDFGLSFQFQMA